MHSDAQWSRRRFLRAAAVGFPLLLPARVALGQGPGSPSARIVTGHIGLGPAGRAHLQARRGNVGAVCDVDTNRLYEGAALAGPGTEVFPDYRRILDRKDVDAIVIATPDHWHASMAIEAIEAGKDVYIEAPASRSLGEGLRLARTARYFGAVVQAGPGAVALERPTGPEVTAWGAANPAGGDPRTTADPPEGLDWPAWVGPLRPRPYHPDALHGGDRWMMDLGGGQIRQQGAALFAIALHAWGMAQPESIEVYAEGLPQRGGLWDCPRELRATISFPGQPQVIRWTQAADTSACGMRLHGPADMEIHQQDGRLMLEDGTPLATDAALDMWLSAIRTRTLHRDDFDRAILAASLGTLSNLSYRLGRKLTWRPATGRFLDDAIADRFIEDLG